MRPSTAPCRGGSPTSAADIARLDAELVRRGLARSRGEAQEFVRAGQVTVGGSVAAKPSLPVADDVIEVEVSGPRWVGRAAHKLDAALQEWAPEGLTVQGRRCVDVGASTGGFTQVLLAAGAAHVAAVDVGHGQLVPEVANDPRVTEHSGTTIRGLQPETIGGPADLVVADLSFISLTLVLADLVRLMGERGDLVVLVKPQFEVGRGRLNRQGVVTDQRDRTAALHRVVEATLDAGLFVHGIRQSPIAGTTGNVEYLLWARSDPSDTMSADRVREIVRETTTEARGGRA
ncbi:TlyA family RNA methyltransferase [Ornithinibacter aureus]|uniref:TlyA family RNA methyltransferase n=1 Tax=Ornithinibacter aureus TaxID=622664 RepID=UPI00135981B4|nr:TlyA family RNA methyltransferase [Ornithinibacter aureus]KAF0832555.1 23S rRNA (cytidine1920-2'-O)/16S rRNA (cytidine1409-2'-O)-methyltransferase [Ornithinibacter aureus]